MTPLLSSFGEDFRDLVRSSPDAVAIIDARSGRFWSYGEFDDLTSRLATFLGAQGTFPGRAIVSILPNSVDAFALFIAAMKVGVDYAPLTPEASPRDLERWLALVSPSLCVVSPFLDTGLEDQVSRARLAVCRITPNGRFDWLADQAPAVATGLGDRPARLLLNTSGTTGEPKVLVFDCDKLWSSGRAFTSHFDFIDAEARFFNMLPMSYLGGLFNLGLIPLAQGGSAVIGEAFSGKTFMTFWQDVERFDINVLWLVPTMARGLLAIAKRTKRTHSDTAQGTARPPVRACLLGTAPIDLMTKQAFEETFGIPMVENFALSETTFLTSETVDFRSRRLEHSVGEVLPYVDLRIASASRVDDVGEIEVKTPYLFLGYMREDGEIELQLTPDGYFRTGDLGKMESEETLIYSGRTRDIIKKGGYFVSLREIEVRAELHPLVEEAVAVAVPDSFYGEDHVLLVRLVESGQVTADAIADIRSWVRNNVAKYKWPKEILPREDFPRTASGKIKKQLLSASLVRDLSQHVTM